MERRRATCSGVNPRPHTPHTLTLGGPIPSPLRATSRKRSDTVDAMPMANAAFGAVRTDDDLVVSLLKTDGPLNRNTLPSKPSIVRDEGITARVRQHDLAGRDGDV